MTFKFLLHSPSPLLQDLTSSPQPHLLIQLSPGQLSMLYTRVTQSIVCYQFTKREEEIEGKHLETFTVIDRVILNQLNVTTKY